MSTELEREGAMTDELKQLAAEYQRRMSWLIDETTNWTLFLEDFGRDVQRQTVEAACRAECQYCRDYYGSAEVTPTPVFLERQYVPDNCGVIEGWVHARSWGGYWRCNADRIRRALLSPSQEEQVRKSMSERVKIVSHNGSWWIQEYGGLTQGPFTRRIAEDILSKILQRGEPAAEPQEEKGCAEGEQNRYELLRRTTTTMTATREGTDSMQGGGTFMKEVIEVLQMSATKLLVVAGETGNQSLVAIAKNLQDAAGTLLELVHEGPK